ncbi:hypothetical protein OXX79_007697 [Metschnikowia pulcherrima]
MHKLIWALPLLQLQLSAVSAAAAAASAEYSPLDSSSLHESVFFEQFLTPDLASSGWVPSSARKIDGPPYNGKWAIREAHKYPGFSGDNGLVMDSEADFFGISKKLPEPFIRAGRDLVLQFEVKFQDGVTCGGAYLKLVSGLEPASFSDSSRYEIMFGPDICGSENRVHFLMKRAENDDTDSKLRTPPMAKTDALSALYTLIIRANNEMEIRINGGVAKAGHLHHTPHLMVPPVSVPEFVPDMRAQKPADWDDRPVILDDSVEKPADYDEKHNLMWIADPDVRKPENWNDDETAPLYIADPTATRPEEWDDEEDGVWNAPLIPNPECAHGCGKWEAPKIANPSYKGEWMPPAIANPNYMGEWVRPQIRNPLYGNTSAGFRPIDGIGIDVWSMQAGVMFNNIYLGHSIAEAERIGNETFVPKFELEYANYKKTKPRAKHEPKAPPKTFDDMLEDSPSFVSMLKSPFLAEIRTAKTLWKSFQADPVTMMTQHPFRFAGYCFVFVIAFTLTFGFANVLLFVYLSSREDAKEHDRKSKEALEKEKSGEKEKVSELSEEEMIAQITGKATGVSARDTTTRKIR